MEHECAQTGTHTCAHGRARETCAPTDTHIDSRDSSCTCLLHCGPAPSRPPGGQKSWGCTSRSRAGVGGEGVDAHWAGWSPGGGGAGQGGARVDTHLPQGAGQTAELVGRVDGHHTHGGRGDGPAQGIGPLGEGVGSVVRGPEGHDTHHDHKLKVRAELKLQLPAGRPGGPGARVSRGGSPGQGGSGVRALQTAPLRVGALTCRSARAGVGWGGGCAPPHPWWPCLAHALRVTVSRRPPPRRAPRPGHLSSRSAAAMVWRQVPAGAVGGFGVSGCSSGGNPVRAGGWAPASSRLPASPALALALA